MADDADVFQRLVLQPGPDVAHHARDPSHQPRDQRDHAGGDAGKPGRKQKTERQQHESLGGDEQRQLDRMGRQVAGRPVNRDQLEERRAGSVGGDENPETEPLADHDLAAPHGPGEHRQKQAALDLAGDQRSGDDRCAEGKDPAEHERDHDQELRCDEGDLLRGQGLAGAVGDCRDLVEAPRGEADDDQGEDHQGEQQPAARGLLDRQPRDHEHRRHQLFSSSARSCRKRSSRVSCRGATS